MAPSHSDQDDLITELAKDHREVEEMFVRLEKGARDPGERQQLVRDVTYELVRHGVAEERHLYPLARTALDDGDRIAEAEIAEHD